ncbi:MAG: hypothetical protein NDI82_03145 [Anaeromyxobacteraceae bacterium]|nr:hypothetical protein [Anaeromyxobacteraceae bacterium]
MAPRRVVIIGLLAVGAGLAGAAAWLARDTEPAAAPAGARLPTRNFPGGGPFRAEEITEGRLSPERLPLELNAALEAHSAEIVRNAEAIEQKQARVTGTCAPGSAIRVIGEDGSVSCQKLPRGVVSVSALVGVPRLSTTGTAQGSVKGGVGRFQTSGEDDFLVVPVALPDGAQVTGFSYAFYDVDPRVDGAAYLYRSDDQPMSALATSTAADEVRVVSTEEVKLRKVDTSRFAYFVYFQISAEAGANLVPISASVTYRLP